MNFGRLHWTVTLRKFDFSYVAVLLCKELGKWCKLYRVMKIYVLNKCEQFGAKYSCATQLNFAMFMLAHFQWHAVYAL